jgi:hypothetical protein
MKGRRAVLRGALDFCTVSLVAQDALQGAEAGFEDFLNPLYLIDVLNVPEVTLWDFIRTRDVGPSPLVRSLLPAPPLQTNHTQFLLITVVLALFAVPLFVFCRQLVDTVTLLVESPVAAVAKENFVVLPFVGDAGETYGARLFIGLNGKERKVAFGMGRRGKLATLAAIRRACPTTTAAAAAARRGLEVGHSARKRAKTGQ